MLKNSIFHKKTKKKRVIGLVRGGPTFDPVKYVKESESREAYACRLNFGPVQFLFEINDHVTKTLIENSLLVQFELMKVDQK